MSKYHNRKTVVNGIKFDSAKEAARYQELMLLLHAGEIDDLRLQVRYRLHEPYTEPDGKKNGAIDYVADFTYLRDGQRIVEDVKGVRTSVYLLKRRMLKEKYGIDIVEV